MWTRRTITDQLICEVYPMMSAGGIGYVAYGRHGAKR
jgi:hypothetical protein